MCDSVSVDGEIAVKIGLNHEKLPIHVRDSFHFTVNNFLNRLVNTFLCVKMAYALTSSSIEENFLDNV